MPCSACGGGSSRQSTKKAFNMRRSFVKQQPMTVQQYQLYLRYLQEHQARKGRFQLRF